MERLLKPRNKRVILPSQRIVIDPRNPIGARFVENKKRDLFCGRALK